MTKFAISAILLTSISFADVSFNGNKVGLPSREEMAQRIQENDNRIKELEMQVANLSKSMLALTETPTRKTSSEPKKAKTPKIIANDCSNVFETPTPKTVDTGCKGVFDGSSSCSVVFEKVN